jgi:diguanylate cyclase (GGDEF)-like protein
LEKIVWLDVDGYTIETELFQDKASRIYRACRNLDGKPVILKIQKNDFPTSQEYERYEREFHIASQLNLKHGVRAIALLRSRYRMVIVFEDDGCISLRRLYGGRALDVRKVLSIGLGIANAVAELHGFKFMHNGLSSSNVLVHPNSGEIMLTDFGLAHPAGSEAEPFLHQKIGALAYTAPEKTGRTNQIADFRSDLYSIGIILYEIAAGKHPFAGLDDAALSHAHIAVTPVSVFEHNPLIPEILDALILKLMAKDPSDRYQTANGLLKDLRYLLQQWDGSARLEDFSLGLSDRSVEFLKTEKLYGREDILLKLDRAYIDASRQSQPVWVSLNGSAGCGKSSLVNIFAERLPVDQVICIGRAEQLEHAPPFAALIPAFSNLLRHWLALPEEKISALHAQLQKTLGVNAAVLAPLLPELNKLLGPLPELSPLETVAEHTRFQLTVMAFIEFAAKFQKPLVLFIDDLQWADLATLGFLENLLVSGIRPCLLITASLEDHKEPAFVAWHSKLSAAGIKQNRIVLDPLSLSEIGEMIHDCLGELEGGQLLRDTLAEIVFQKTLGNPFFTYQFLNTLVQKELLTAHTGGSKCLWRLNTERIDDIDLADNVLDLLSERISSLPDNALRQLLEYAACIGESFDMDTIAFLMHTKGSSLDGVLFELVRLGMIRMSPLSRETYSFMHNRIREAALSLLPAQAREAIHWRIGKYWLEGRKRGVFEIVGQLNRGSQCAQDASSRFELALLNAEAAYAARTRTAYKTALEYAIQAVSFYQTGDFQESKDFLSLQILLADCQASAGQLEASIRTFNAALGHAQSPEKQAKILKRMAEALHSSGQPAQALIEVQRALEILGQALPLPRPEDTTKSKVLSREQEQLFEQLSDPIVLIRFEHLGNANERASLVSSLYDKAIISVYFTQPALLGFVTARTLQHVLTTGLTPESGLAFAWWSMVLCMRDQHKLAEGYAALAKDMHIRFGDDYYGGGGRMVATAMALCWTRDYAENFEEAGESVRLLHQSGNLQFASYGLITQHIIRIVEAADCRAMLESCQHWADYCERYVPLELGQARIRIYCLEKLCGLNPASLDCEAIVREYAEQNNATDVCESLTEMARFAWLTGDFKAALELSERAHPILIAGGAGTLLLNYLHWVILAISSARMAAISNEGERKRLYALYEQSNLRIQHLSRLHPVNFTGYRHLVSAEGARMYRDWDTAISEYLAAIGHARSHGYTLLQALATQNLAEIFQEQGHGFAYGIARDAQQLYQNAWCLLKANLRDGDVIMPLDQSSRTMTSRDSADGIDLVSIMKASEAITSEIDFNTLLLRLLEITIENAGAQRGVIALRKNTEFTVVADSAFGRIDEQLLESKTCPIKLLLYVARSGQALVLDDGSRCRSFRDEPYFHENRVRSVLTCPMMLKGELRGILYLENNSVAGVFTHERLETINMLLGPAAIALENAELYLEQKRYTQELEARVSERTAELRQANAMLAKLANFDSLTQVANRRGFDCECERLASSGSDVTLILCDIDYFKAYNDHYGHLAGDLALQKVAAAIAGLPLPVPGLAARYGGEEFALLLETENLTLAYDLACLINKAIAKLEIPHAQSLAAKHITLSLGVASIAKLSQDSIPQLIGMADTALYWAKTAGRDQVMINEGNLVEKGISFNPLTNKQ